METIVATIYADRASQLEKLGFKPEAIQERRSKYRLWGDSVPAPWYEVELRVHPLECDHATAMKRALDFLSRAKTKQGKTRAGYETSLEFENEYSPVYD